MKVGEKIITRNSSEPIHSDHMTDIQWQGMPLDPYQSRSKKGGPPKWLFVVLGVLLPVLFWLIGWKILATIAISIFMIVSGAAALSPKIKNIVEKFVVWFSHIVAKSTTWILLTPIYLIGFSLIRLFMFLCGLDPLRLNARSEVTFWEWCDNTERNVKSVTRMFCSEVPKVFTARIMLVGGLFVGAFLLITGEITLRLMGYADPILYTHDPEVCYLPQPNQHVKSLRGEVILNNFSMRRSGEIATEKPEQVYRILLLGDSTLYGGEYLTNEQTYASIVERELNQFVPEGKRVEVLPMGVNSWGPYQKIGYIRKFGTFNADQVIMCMPVGDAYRYAFSMEHLPYARRKPTFGWEMVALNLSWRYRNHMQIPGGWSINETEEYFRKGVGVYVDLTNLLKQSVSDVSYELLPQGSDGFNENTSTHVANELQMFREGLATTGVAISYPAGLFARKGNLEGVYHSRNDQAHLGVLGHQLYAQYLADKIKKSNQRFIKFSQH